MTKTFTQKTAYELEQEMHQYFHGSIDEIAINYWRTKEEYLKELQQKRQQLLGYYIVKSPYHRRTFYLPFIITSYDTESGYHVYSTEYKGCTRYQSDSYYTEKTIHGYIESGLIQKVAAINQLPRSKQVVRLIALYRNAKTPIE